MNRIVILGLILVNIMMIKSSLTPEQIIDLTSGVLNGFKLESNRDQLGKCVVSAINYQNLADHDWNTLIFWQENKVQPIPEVNNTLLTQVSDQLFDDSYNFVNQCGDLGYNTTYFFIRLIKNLITKQGWADMLQRIKSQGFEMLIEVYNGYTKFVQQDYYNAGLNWGKAGDTLLEEQKQIKDVKIRKLLNQNRLLMYSFNGLLRKVQKKLQESGIKLKNNEILQKIVQGLIEGLMNLSDTPDFVGCVFSGLNAKTFFQKLTPADVENAQKLAATIKSMKGVISPIVQGCLQGVDDLLIRVNQAIQFVTNWNTQNFLQVLLDDSNFMADSLASIIKLYVAGDITEGTASIVIVLEKVMWDIYAKDQQIKYNLTI